MEIQLVKRRECGDSHALDIYLPRTLLPEELKSLASTCQGSYRPLGNLVWLDFPFGRITASKNSQWMTLRLNQREQESTILEHLQAIPNSIT